MSAKQNRWLDFYLDDDNSETYFNATASAKAAGYEANSYSAFGVIGHDNLKSLKNEINKYIDEVALSEEGLKKKLNELLEAKETKFFAKDGIVISEKVVKASEVRRKTLDMAMKAKGMYKADNEQKREAISDDMIVVGLRIAKSLTHEILEVDPDEDPLQLEG
jgi:phage terminase small subunit